MEVACLGANGVIRQLSDKTGSQDSFGFDHNNVSQRDLAVRPICVMQVAFVSRNDATSEMARHSFVLQCGRIPVHRRVCRICKWLKIA